MECFCTKYLNKYGQLNNKINKKSLDHHIVMSDNMGNWQYNFTIFFM